MAVSVDFHVKETDFSGPKKENKGTHGNVVSEMN